MENREVHVHVHLHLDALHINVSHTVTADAAVTALFHSIKEDIAKMSNTVQEALDKLTTDVAQEITVEQSAVTLIQGIPALIAAAVAQAQALGATPAQLAAFDALSTQIEGSSAPLAAAVAANTPAAPGT